MKTKAKPIQKSAAQANLEHNGGIEENVPERGQQELLDRAASSPTAKIASPKQLGPNDKGVVQDHVDHLNKQQHGAAAKIASRAGGDE